MDPNERSEIRAKLGLTHKELGMTLGFSAKQAKITSERRNFSPDSKSAAKTRPSEVVLLRLLGDQIVTPEDCLKRSPDPVVRENAEAIAKDMQQSVAGKGTDG